MFCQKCGKEIQAGTNFCPNCGYKIGIINEAESTDFIADQEVVSNNNVKDSAGSKIGKSYIFSVLSVVICFFIRVTMQREYRIRFDWLDSGYYLCLPEDIKPFCTIIPIIAAIIISLLIVSDTKSNTQRKAIAFIWNGVFIALALLFIWFDLPV